MTSFSFDVKYLGFWLADPLTCPCCGSNLAENDAITVRSSSINRGEPFKTKIGTEGPYLGYVMDDNMDDSTLVLADHCPDICCSECEELLQQDEHEEYDP